MIKILEYIQNIRILEYIRIYTEYIHLTGQNSNKQCFGFKFCDIYLHKHCIAKTEVSEIGLIRKSI